MVSWSMVKYYNPNHSMKIGYGQMDITDLGYLIILLYSQWITIGHNFDGYGLLKRMRIPKHFGSVVSRVPILKNIISDAQNATQSIK